MTVFDENQIKFLRGSYSKIASLEQCTPQYVKMVLIGKRSATGKKASKVIAKANELLAVLQPIEQ